MRAAYAAAPFDEDWAETIRKATERVTTILAPRNGLAVDPAPPVGWDSTPVFELLGRERFAEALAYMRGAPTPAQTDTDLLLLEAALLVHNAHIPEAQELCQRLLLRDEFSAGAHYLLALCCEHAGRRAQACEHDRVAAYLDPAFAMPRLHLGLLAGRSGDRDSARRELARALMLLEHEDASRILLFGGGFNRKALTDLCRSALLESGGTA
jgi:chemotaxis protein methyltransferase CheR